MAANVRELVMQSSGVTESNAIIFGDGQVETFSEGDVSKLQCISSGAMPEPELLVSVACIAERR